MSNSEWGAIPRSLANDVSNMIEKKMGTSSGYKPVEWVSQINLMGKLPVKSASGAIASFSDGADGVPVKSCSVSFVASGGGGTPSAPVAITGVSGLSVTRTGKNLLNVNATDTTNGYIHYYYLLNTGETYYNADWSISEYIEVKGNMSFTLSGIIGGNPSICFYDANKTFLSGVKYGGANPKTVTSPSGAVYARVSFENSLKDTWQLEVGSTATTYSAYVTPSVVTDTFGQTIHGGTRDLTTDKASVTWVCHKITANDEINLYASANGFRLPTEAWSEGVMVSQTNSGGICNIKTTVTESNVDGVRFGLANNNQIYFVQAYNTFGNTVEAFKQYVTNNDVYVCYKLATPTEITGLTPHEIDTLYGDNNIYADTGTTTVEYRADIDLALNA